jgi:hypothetical protein
MLKSSLLSFTVATLINCIGVSVTNDWIRYGNYNGNAVLSEIMTNHRNCNQNNMTGATCGAGTVYHSIELEFTQS